MKVFLLSLCWLMLAGLNPALQAAEVEASGAATIYGSNTASARDQALKNALRQAVEQGVGTLIDSNTLAVNYEVIRDEIYSSSQGYVTEYEILQEGVSSDGTSFEVRIRAQVSEGKIEDKLTALRILHQKMGSKRLMVLYQGRDPHALPEDNSAVSQTLGTIRNEMNQAGFRIFNEQQTQQVSRAIEQAAGVNRSTELLIAAALDQQAEIVLRVEVIGGKKDEKGGLFWVTRALVRLEAFDTSTGRQIADAAVEGKELAANPPGPYDWLRMLSKAGERAGQDVSRQAIDQIARYYQRLDDQGFAYQLIFRDFSFEQEDQIIDYLEGTPGFKQLKELQNTSKYLELELFSTEEKSRLRRQIRRDLLEQEIEVAVQSVSGNRMVFLNPNP